VQRGDWNRERNEQLEVRRSIVSGFLKRAEEARDRGDLREAETMTELADDYRRRYVEVLQRAER